MCGDEERMFALQLQNLNPDPSSATNSLYDFDQGNAFYLALVSLLLNVGARLGRFHLHGLCPWC